MELNAISIVIAKSSRIRPRINEIDSVFDQAFYDIL